MQMKKEYFKPILFIVLGICIGSVMTQQYISKRLISKIEAIWEDEWILAKSYLTLATAIRNNKSSGALKFTEQQIVLNVNNFTNKGNSLNDLTKHEISTIKQIKSYWEEHCKKECLQDISQILNDERFMK
jgi:hypothetical protein